VGIIGEEVEELYWCVVYVRARAVVVRKYEALCERLQTRFNAGSVVE